MKGDFLCIYLAGKCCMVLTINLALLIIGGYVSTGFSEKFGRIISIETQEWNTSPIVDIIS
jgi:hypothetical protein